MPNYYYAISVADWPYRADIPPDVFRNANCRFPQLRGKGISAVMPWSTHEHWRFETSMLLSQVALDELVALGFLVGIRCERQKTILVPPLTLLNEFYVPA